MVKESEQLMNRPRGRTYRCSRMPSAKLATPTVQPRYRCEGLHALAAALAVPDDTLDVSRGKFLQGKDGRVQHCSWGCRFARILLQK